jgi:hypothetical protein
MKAAERVSTKCKTLLVARLDKYTDILGLLNSCRTTDCLLKFNPLKSDFFFRGATSPSGPGHSLYRGFTITLILDTPHSVGLLWTNDQPDSETFT